MEASRIKQILSFLEDDLIPPPPALKFIKEVLKPMEFERIFKAFSMLKFSFLYSANLLK